MKAIFDIVNIISMILEIIIINNYFQIVSKAKKDEKKQIVLTSISLIFVQIVIILFVKEQLYTTLAVFASMLILSIFYEMNIYARILFSVGLLGLLMIAELIIGLVLSVVYSIPVENASENVMFYLQGVMLSKLFMIIIFKIYTFLKVSVEVRPSGKLFIALMTQPIATCLAIYVMSTYLYDESDIKKIFFTVVVAVLLIAANIFMFYLMEYVMSENEKRNERQLFKQQLEYRVDYYKELSERQKISNKTMHDLKNQLFALKSSFDEDGTSGMEKLNQLCEDVLQGKSTSYTGKESVDALISAKSQKMESLNIEFKTSIFMLKNDVIDIFDLCVVIGNVLDNAIEACSKIKNGTKDIYLEIKQNGNYLYIKTVNPIDQEICIENGIIKTTKKHSETHGFGLKSIKEITEKYSGSATYKQENGKFLVVVLLKN